MAEVILKAQNLVKKYGDKEVLKGVDIDIRAGEIFGIIGSSGSGKTTLLNSLIGFVSPTNGEILFRDPHLLSYKDAGENHAAYRNVLHYPKQVKEIFGFAAQDPSVYGKLSVMENLDLFGSLYNLSRDSRKTNAHILLKLMGLYNSRKFQATNLSGGMLKRLDIACSLIHDPKVLILDEPTADLDPYLRRHMWDLIRKINKKGTTIIISSHYLDEIEELCDRIGIMSNGKMQHYGTPKEIKKIDDGSEEIHVRTEYKRYDILAKKLSARKSTFKISQIRNNGGELVIRSKDPLATIAYIVKTTKKIEDSIVDLRLNKPSLNEIFASFVEENQGGDLATHQKNIEQEQQERIKEKWWYKFKEKCKIKPRTYDQSPDSIDEFRSPKEKQKSVRSRDKVKPQKELRPRRERKPLWEKRVQAREPKQKVRPTREKKQRKPFIKKSHSRKRAEKPIRVKKSRHDDPLDDLADLRKRIEQLRVDTSTLRTKRRSRR